MHVSNEHETEVLKSNQDVDCDLNPWGAIEELRKELISATNEISKLHKELQSAKTEVESLRRENATLRSKEEKKEEEEEEQLKDGEDTCSDTVDSQSPSEMNDADRRDEEDSRGVASGSCVGHVSSPKSEKNCESDEEDDVVTDDQGTDDEEFTDHDEFTDNDDCEDDEVSGEGTDEEKEAEPTADQDIRLRAARTLIWADSAIKKNNAPGRRSSLENPASVPSTVHFQNSFAESRSFSESRSFAESRSCSSSGTNSSPGLMSRSPDDCESIVSTPESEDGSYRGQKRGPFAGLRQRLEDKMDDLIDEIDEMMAPEKEKAPHPSPQPSYKYCNDAFRKMNEESRPSQASRPEEGKKTPYCNEAFLKLSQAKKKKGPFGFLKN